MRVTFKKRSRVFAGLLGCFAFIALAIWGWGLPLATAIDFLIICLVGLLVILLLAAGIGWLLRMINRRGDDTG